MASLSKRTGDASGATGVSEVRGQRPRQIKRKETAMNPFYLIHGGSIGIRLNFGLVLLVAAGVLAGSMVHVNGAWAGNTTTNNYGSGKLYKTWVERQSEGDLSAEDLHQASLLTSQLLEHVNKAGQLFMDNQSASARAEIERAESLLKIVRGLLPRIVVTTTVRDAQGKEVYHDVETVQDDQIPVFEGQVAVETVEPIIEAKRDEAALKGLKLAEADVINTAILVDLGFVERKLKRATELLSQPKEAAEQLAQAQSQGVRFYTHKEDSPLVDVQHALRLAERMVREKKYEAAKANLQSAKLQLEAYRALVGDSAGQSAANLEKDIQKLSGELENPGSADKIGGMWDRVTSWFKREAGQAHQTTNTAAQVSSK